MKRSRLSFVVVVLGCALAVALPGSVRAQAEPLRVADVQVRSGTDETAIIVGLPAGATVEDRSRTRPGRPADATHPAIAADESPPPKPMLAPGTSPAEETAEAAPTPAEGRAAGGWTLARGGAITIDEIRLFFRGASVERPRAITIGDRIVEETRIFPEDGGVTMTVTVRRPVYYTVGRHGGRLRVRLVPAVILVAQPKPPAGGAEPTPPKPQTKKLAGGGAVRPGGAPGGVQTQLPVPTLQFQTLETGEGLTVDAENLTVDQEHNEVVAKGHVTIARAGGLLTADQVRINRDTQKAEASGNVQITDPQGTVAAEDFSGDLEDETGVLRESTIYLAQNHLTISGQRVEKSFGQTYHIENGKFTTCQCGVGAPSWSIAGKEIDVTLDGYGYVKGAYFEVGDQPIMYLPWMAFPAKVSRQTGLLAPIIGYSKKRGFQYLQPLYVAINKSADATISADIETEARVGAIGEYRWALDPLSKGTLNVSFFDESLRNNAERDIVDQNVAEQSIPKDRWSVTSSIRHQLPFEITAFVDALAVSDDFFLREIPTFSFDPEYERQLRTSRFSTTKGGIFRVWDHATLIAQAVYYQDFIQEGDFTLQRLPDVSLFASQRFLERHVKVSLDGSATNFERTKGFDGPRVDLAPRAEVPLLLGNYLRSKFGVTFRETAYHMSDKDLVQPVSQGGGVQDPSVLGITTLADNPTREIFQGDASLSTEINRIFPFHVGDIEKLKHTIEPGVDYRYVPDVQQDDLPIYDFVDRMDRENRFTYGITSRLLGKFSRPTMLEDRSSRRSVTGLSSFSGVTPSPFDDENTRGGLDALGTPEPLPEPGQTGETAEAPEAAPDTPEVAAERPADRAERLKQERSVLSHIAELARLQISQSYDVDQSLQTKEDDNFSDVDVNLRLNPTNFFSLGYSTSFDPKHARLDQASVGILLRDPRRRSPTSLLAAAQRASIGISYQLITDRVLQEVDGSLVVPLADTLSTFAITRYDALSSKFLENRFGFRLTSQCQCWVLDLFVADRVNPNETEVRTQITLIGLGSIGRSR